VKEKVKNKIFNDRFQLASYRINKHCEIIRDLKGKFMEEKQTPTTLSGEHWLSYILPVSLIAGLVALLTIIADQPMEELQPIIPQEEWLTQLVGWLIMLAEAAAALVIGAAVVRAIISYEIRSSAEFYGPGDFVPPIDE
jgi:hypothetical protein